MKSIYISLIIGISMIFCTGCSDNSMRKDEISIIPNPLSLTTGEGEFAITGNTRIYCNEGAEKTAGYLAEFLRRSTGYALPVEKTAAPEKQSKGIILSLSGNRTTEPEAYQLHVTPEQILISATDAAGLFNGVQSLRQLLPPAIESQTVVKAGRWIVPAVTIDDKPVYKWRGYMQDVSRTFFNVEFMKKYMDAMALYKLNTLHFHLTDDQGWRIEIKKYPELTSRKTTVFPGHHNQPPERSGFYTQEDIKELVAYAAERNITIVPEIDVPGHCWPVILTHPELGVNDVREPDYVMPFLASWSYWGFQFTPNPLDPTKESVYSFLDDIFTEVSELFPGEYIHFGGDEVVHRLWEDEPHVKAFMRQKGMKNVTELQSYFVNRVSDMILQKGKKPMGWSDILNGAETLDKRVAMMSWLSDVKGATSAGFDIVAAPYAYLYLDITQDSRDDGTLTDLAYQNINSMDRIYSYDPLEGLAEEEKSHVLGIQGNMWPAVAQHIKDVNVQNFPRWMALSEIAWSAPSRKNYEDFLKRVDAHYPRLDEMKIDYFRKGGYITGTWIPKDLSTDFQRVEWDVTKKVYANGRIMVGFYYTHGENFMQIRSVQLLRNGDVISEDLHPGLADDYRATSKPKTYLYNLLLSSYEPGDTYIIRAEVAGVGGTDSYGNFVFNLSPYKPFTVVEPAP